MKPFGLKNRFIGITVGLCVLGLPGCSPRPNFATLPTNYKSVAIISLLPQTITMSRIGFTVFQNHSDVFPTSFDPNAVAIKTANATLSQRYRIVDLGIDQNAFFETVEKNFTWVDSFPGPHTDDLVADQLKARVRPGLADLVVVIDGTEPPKYASFLSGGGVEVGLYSFSGYDQHGIGFQDDHIGLAATVEVFDGSTLQVLGYGHGGLFDAIPSDLSWRGAPYKDLTDEQKQDLATIEEEAITEFVPGAFRNAHLVSD